MAYVAILSRIVSKSGNDVLPHSDAHQSLAASHGVHVAGSYTVGVITHYNAHWSTHCTYTNIHYNATAAEQWQKL